VFPSILKKLTIFGLIYFFAPPILTVMHLCSMLYTYWTPLSPSNLFFCLALSIHVFRLQLHQITELSNTNSYIGANPKASTMKCNCNNGSWPRYWATSVSSQI